MINDSNSLLKEYVVFRENPIFLTGRLGLVAVMIYFTFWALKKANDPPGKASAFPQMLPLFHQKLNKTLPRDPIQEVAIELSDTHFRAIGIAQR